MQMCVCDYFILKIFPAEIVNFKSRIAIEKIPFHFQRNNNNQLFFLLVNRLSLASVGKSYETILEESAGFDNPQCIEHLSQSLGLDSSIFYTNMSGLRGKYPNEEYATDLRQSQASSWAFR